MAKSKNMRWFHRAFARAAQLTGRTNAVEQGVRLADGLAQSVWSKGAMPRRTALKTLADVEFTFGLPDPLTNYISNSVLGTHSKVIAGFDSTPWRDVCSNGDALSDGPMQACWDSNPKKEGQGSLSFLIGGLVTSYMNQLASLQWGTDGTRNGIQWGINWVQEEGYTGSYTCLKPGQYTAVESLFFFDGNEDERQVAFLDNLAFIGESFSGDYWATWKAQPKPDGWPPST